MNPVVHRTRRVVLPGVLGALGFVLMYVAFPLGIFPSYLTYDPGDVPALLVGLALGPWAGLAAEVVKNALSFLLQGATPIGIAANTLAGGVFVVSAAALWSAGGRRSAGWALAGAALLVSMVMAAANALVFLPAWGVPSAQVLPTVWGAILPFNLVKFSLSSVLAYAVWARLGARLTASAGTAAAGAAAVQPAGAAVPEPAPGRADALRAKGTRGSAE
ncbi:MAG: ECF transporter S component [Clostridia bacterium]|nr:ECF transporter S component [Clostridia bacterium]